MTTISTITKTYAPEMEALNCQIERRLSASNPLMSTIVRSQLRTKGKQIRPLLLIMCAKIFGAVTEKVLASAASVELIHNASLIHDDVVDNSMTRRNQSTINAVWDNHIAVLVGDFFTSSAMQEAISTGEIRIIDAICSLGRDLSLGEIDQIYNAREHSLDREAYFRVVDYKTASLFVASARMGAMAAGAPEDMVESLGRFALLLGRCFQLRDDVFDYYDSTAVGKPTGNDLREGKVTLPILIALENKPDTEISDLLKHNELSDEQIARIQSFARDNGGVEGTYAEMYALRQEASEILDAIDSPVAKTLGELFDFIIARQF